MFRHLRQSHQFAETTSRRRSRHQQPPISLAGEPNGLALRIHQQSQPQFIRLDLPKRGKTA